MCREMSGQHFTQSIERGDRLSVSVYALLIVKGRFILLGNISCDTELALHLFSVRQSSKWSG